MYLHRVILHRVQDFTLVITELQEVAVRPFLQPLEVPQNNSLALSTLTTSLAPPTNLVRAYSVPLFRLFMKMFNSIGPNVSPSETPLETGHWLDFVLLITIP